MYIVELLSRSSFACQYFPPAIKVSFDTLFGKTTYPRLRTSGISYINSIFEHSKNSQQLKKLAPIFKTGLIKLINMKIDNNTNTMEYIEKEDIRIKAYQTIAKLSSLVSSYFKLVPAAL